MEIIPTNGASRSQILASIRDHGIAINDSGYTHQIMSSWKAVSDGSLSAGGFELVSPPMKGARNIENQIIKICDALRGLASVNRTCGLHIHFEVLDKHHFKRRVNTRTTAGKLRALQNKPAKLFTCNLLRNYGYFQPVIDTLVSPSRRNNNYARNIPVEAQLTKEGIKQFSESDNYAHLHYGMSGRYQVVNLSSLETYGTVEFRQHNGTVNAKKIINWIKLLERMTTRSWDRKYTHLDCEDFPLTIDGLMDFLGFGINGVRKYSRNRAISNGFRAISGIETPSANTATSQRDAETDGALNETLNNSENTELTESLLVLENNYNSYHRIRNSVFEYNVETIDIHGVEVIIEDELTSNHLPVNRQIVDAIMARFQDILNEINERC